MMIIYNSTAEEEINNLAYKWGRPISTFRLELQLFQWRAFFLDKKLVLIGKGNSYTEAIKELNKLMEKHARAKTL